MSVEDVLVLMIQVGMFDDAVNLAKKFSLPLIHIFEALSSRYKAQMLLKLDRLCVCITCDLVMQSYC